MDHKGFFITGIHTGVGKTITSGILTEALEADYWKPVQSGWEPQTDTERVKTLVQNKKTVFHPESWLLSTPLSPDASAKKEGKTIDLKEISLPDTKNTIVVEGAGGILTPLNEDQTFLDFAEKLGLPVILVSMHYLGSINHTLLSLHILHQRKLPLCAVIFTGEKNPDSEERIQKELSKLYPEAVTAQIGFENTWNKKNVLKWAKKTGKDLAACI